MESTSTHFSAHLCRLGSNKDNYSSIFAYVVCVGGNPVSSAFESKNPLLDPLLKLSIAP